MNSLRPLILDLDFTLLHLECVPYSIEVPGRTRSAYLGGATVEALCALQDRFEIVLATARSWDGTRWVANGLSGRGVGVDGVVLEDGALLGALHDFAPLEPQCDWESLRATFDARREPDWPPFEWQLDFKACLVARAATPQQARQLAAVLQSRASMLDATLRVFRDGRKVYVASQRADKWTALQVLLGERVNGAVGIGDGLNDLCWLQGVATPCTLIGAAPAVVEAVLNRGGMVSPLSGHDGIVDVLQRLA